MCPEQTAIREATEMADDALDLYRRASDWTLTKVRGAAGQLRNTTPCDEWDVRTLLNHMLDTERYFTSAARGQEAALPSPTPPDLIGDDPVAAFERAQSDLLSAFGGPGVADKSAPALGIALADQLLHGWDVAEATGQDATMPTGLAEAAYGMIHGRFTEDQRRGVFKPAVAVADDASPQDRFLAYTGRDPAVEK
jgi:uncharacterized protein (TIGR03086 family)